MSKNKINDITLSRCPHGEIFSYDYRCENCYRENRKKLSVDEVLRWSDKHRKLKSKGTRVVHIKRLLSKYAN